MIKTARNSKPVTFAILIVLLAAVGGLTSQVYFSGLLKSKEQDSLHILRLRQAEAHIDDLYRHIGYGGFIHNFKNLLIRRDIKTYTTAADRNISQIRHTIYELSIELHDPKKRVWLSDVQAVFEQYFANYRVLKQKIRAGESIASIDKVVKVDDAPALTALYNLRKSTLQELKIYRGQQAALWDRGQATVYIADLFLFACILIAAYLILRFQKQLNRSHEDAKMTQEITEAAGLGIWEADLSAGTNRWNNATAIIHDFEPGYQLNPERGIEFFKEGESRETIARVFKEAVEEGKSYQVELPIVTAKGNERWVKTIGIPVADENGTHRVYGTIQDITQRKEIEIKIRQHEEELQKIFDAMVDATIVIDEKGIIQTFSKSAERLFGYSAEEVEGKNVKILMPEQYASQHDQYVKNYRETGKAKVIGIGREVTGMRKSGELFPLRLSVSELPPTEKGTRQFIGTCHDLTIEKEQEEMLRHSQRMEAIGKLTGGIAHDFNNMLGIVLGYSELLKNRFSHDDEAAEFVSNITEAGERAKLLVKKILRFSSNQPLNEKVTNINDLITDNRILIEKSLTAKIDFQLTLSSQAWSVNIDRPGFADAFLNVVINAMQAMPDGGIIEVTTSNVSLTEENSLVSAIPSGDYLLISIKDTGSGIPANIVDKIFDPYFTTKGDKGSGLGLAQVYGFVRQSGGTVKVSSTKGKGTTFNLYFPRFQGDLESQEFDTKPEIVREDLSGYGKILVVDDEKTMAEMSRIVLSGQGYEVRTANSGAEALKLLEEKPVDLLISDVIMPGMNGFELAQRARERFPGLKVQLVSGFNDVTDSEFFDKSLEESLIYKPVRNQDLLRRVKSLLKQNPPREMSA